MIVVGGEALVDLLIDPQGNVVAALGGGPFNAARAAARLGSAVSFLGSLSTDRFGRLLLDQLRADGVSDELVSFTELPTTLAAAELDSSGSATYRFYLADTSAPMVADAALPAGTSLFHVGTLGMVLEPMASTLERLVTTVADDAIVLLDPNCRPRVTPDRAAYLARLDRMLRRADVVKVSTDDLDFVSPGDHGAAIRRMLQAGVSAVLHTDGGNGVHIHTVAGTEHVSVPKVEVTDTIGAGDSFGGAFAAFWTQAGLRRDELTDVDAVFTATAAAADVAAVSVTRVGADPPRADDMGGRWHPRRR